MSLKEATAQKHKEAESTEFMKAVFNRSLPLSLWTDWTYQKWLFYKAIEMGAQKHGLLRNLPDIQRTQSLYDDYVEMKKDISYQFRPIVVEYYRYLLTIDKDPDLIMAHLYTWHMGDLFGGQMIKKLIDAPHRSLEFKNAAELKTQIREQLKDSMADEANTAFDWAIRMMRDYDKDLAQN